MPSRHITGLLLALCCFSLLAEVVDIKTGDSINVFRAADTVAIEIDGHVTEAIWQSLPAYDEFKVIEPDTLSDVPYTTLVRLFYTDAGIYAGIVMEQPRSTLIRRLSGWDVRGINRDSINLTLDTSGTGRYGYWFGVNLGDSRSDGTLLPERRFSSDWDGAWSGASQVTETGWSAEMFIPWGTVSMPQSAEKRRLGMYLSRKVAHLDERWAWPALPRTIPRFISDLQTLTVTGVNPKKQYSIFPFAAVGRDLVEDEIRHRVGVDFFWRPSTNIQLTGTLNPDFGNVESDDVVINLTATETFFPEKRLFFLEGQEVFVASPRADTGGRGLVSSGSPYTMLNTRRIGGKPRNPILSADQSIPDRERVQPVELIGALKLTGQAGKLRYGILTAFEEDAKLDGFLTDNSGIQTAINITQPGSKYGVARFLYEDNDSGAYRAFGLLTTAALHEDRDALAQGVDAHYLSADGKIKLDGQVITSDIEGDDRGYGGFVDLEYTFAKGIIQRVGIEYFDEIIDINDLGFLRRNDTFKISSSHLRTISGMSWAKEARFDIRGFVQQNHDQLFTGGGIFSAGQVTFNNLSVLTIKASFSPESYDDLNSFNNGAYRIEQRRDLSLDLKSNTTHALSYSGTIGFSEEDLGGNIYSLKLGLNWRPIDEFAIELSLGYYDRNGWLLYQDDENFTSFLAEQWLPKISADYFLTARQQVRASFQWVGIKAKEDRFYLIPPQPGDLIETVKPAGSSDNFALSQISFQLRYRWEIAPLSDLFVVYTKVSDESMALDRLGFSDLLQEGWDNPTNDILVVKLRYRFGS